MDSDAGRPRRRRRFAIRMVALAATLLIVGFPLTRGGATVHVIGVMAVGYGIGIGVSAAFLLSGWEPGRGRRQR